MSGEQKEPDGNLGDLLASYHEQFANRDEGCVADDNSAIKKAAREIEAKFAARVRDYFPEKLASVLLGEGNLQVRGDGRAWVIWRDQVHGVIFHMTLKNQGPSAVGDGRFSKMREMVFGYLDREWIIRAGAEEIVGLALEYAHQGGPVNQALMENLLVDALLHLSRESKDDNGMRLAKVVFDLREKALDIAKLKQAREAFLVSGAGKGSIQ